MISRQRSLAMLFVIFISVQFASAHEPKSCEPLLLSSFEALTKYALEQKIINVSNVQVLVNADKPINPVSASGQTAVGAKLHDSFNRIIAQIDPKEWPLIQERLSQTVGLLQEDKKITELARQRTQRVLAPQMAAEIHVPASHVIDKVEWTQDSLPTLLLTLSTKLDASTLSQEGFVVKTKAKPKQNLNAFSKKIRDNFPKLKSGLLRQVLSYNPEINILLSSHITDFSSSGSLFVQRNDQLVFVGEVAGLRHLTQCILLEAGHIDCLFDRKDGWSYLRINKKNKVLRVDLDKRSFHSREQITLSHLPDGTPLVAAVYERSVELYKPLESPEPQVILPFQVKEVGWMAVSSSEVYLAVRDFDGEYLIEPFAQSFLKTKLPSEFRPIDLQLMEDRNGQVYLASRRLHSVQILKLYGEVGQ